MHGDSVRTLRTQIDESNQTYCTKLIGQHVQMIKDKEGEIMKI